MSQLSWVDCRLIRSPVVQVWGLMAPDEEVTAAWYISPLVQSGCDAGLSLVLKRPVGTHHSRLLAKTMNYVSQDPWVIHPLSISIHGLSNHSIGYCSMMTHSHVLVKVIQDKSKGIPPLFSLFLLFSFSTPADLQKVSCSSSQPALPTDQRLHEEAALLWSMTVSKQT